MKPQSTQVTASAPGKLMLLGEHAVVYGYPCIVTAVDQRIRVSVRENGVEVFHMSAPDLGLEAYTKRIEDLGRKELPKAVRFVEMLYKRFLEKYPQKRGIVVTTKSDFSSSFGFGSSSAVTVAFAKALTTLYGLELTKKELFDLCYQAVLDVQGVGSGFDLASAIWGGTIYYKPPAEVVEPIKVESLPLVVGYTGIKADTPTLVRMVAKMKEEMPKMVDEVFEEIEQLVLEAKLALEEQNWEQVGKLMSMNQELLEKLKVNSLELGRLIKGAIEGGAQGAKLSGAGGGDCMIALDGVVEVGRIGRGIEESGGEVMKVGLNASGVELVE